MDVIELLVADHNRARGLFARYQAADDAGDPAASVLASDIIEELTVHMAAEEAVFYAAVKERSDEISGDVDEGAEEHHVAKVLIGEIGDLEPGGDRWVAKMTVLIESVEHHVGEEEDELFPAVRSSTTAAWRQQVGERFEADKIRRGATPLADKMALNSSDLYAEARTEEIPGRSTMDHDELAATIDPHRA